MKRKIAVSFVVMFFTCTFATAQISIGVKGIFGLDVGGKYTWADEYYNMRIRQLETYSNFQDVGSAFGGGGIYARYSFPLGIPLGVQLGANFMANNGKNVNYYIGADKLTFGVSYSSLDIPLLATYIIPIGNFSFRSALGMNFSIPVERIYFVEESSSRKNPYRKIGYTPDSRFIVGINASAGVAYHAGPGAFVFDLSFINDFTKLSIEEYVGNDMKEIEILTRRMLEFSLGYELSF